MTPQINSCAYATTVCVASALEYGVDVEVWWPVSFQPSSPENFITIALKQGVSDEKSICNSQIGTSLNSVLQEWTVTPTIVDSTNTISGTNISIYYTNVLENAIASCNSFYMVIFNNYACLTGPNLTYNSFQIFSRLPTSSTDTAASSIVSSYSNSITPLYTPTLGESADSAQTLSKTGITAVSLSLVTLFVSSLAAILFVMYLRKRERSFLPWSQRKSYRNVKSDSGEFLVVSVDQKSNSGMVESINSLGFNEVQHEINNNENDNVSLISEQLNHSVATLGFDIEYPDVDDLLAAKKTSKRNSSFSFSSNDQFEYQWIKFVQKIDDGSHRNL